MTESLVHRAAGDVDRSLLESLYAQTYPELGAGGNRQGMLTSAQALLWSQGATVVGASLVSAVAEESGARRVHVLAADDDGWRAVHELVVRLLDDDDGVQRRYVTVREDCARVVSLLEGLGYHAVSQSWGARLIVTEESLPRLRSLAKRLPSDVRLAVLEADDAAVAYTLRHDHRGDFPATPATQVEEYPPERIAVLVREGRSFGAWSGDLLVALTVLERTAPDTADTDFTVTARAHRGRGLATALKAYAVCALSAQGVRVFATAGAGINEASRRANLRLGYELEPMWITYVAT